MEQTEETKNLEEELVSLEQEMEKTEAKYDELLERKIQIESKIFNTHSDRGQRLKGQYVHIKGQGPHTYVYCETIDYQPSTRQYLIYGPTFRTYAFGFDCDFKKGQLGGGFYVGQNVDVISREEFLDAYDKAVAETKSNLINTTTNQ